MDTVVSFRRDAGPLEFHVHQIIPGHVTIAISNDKGCLQFGAANLTDLLAIAEGIRDAVHLVEIEQLGHQIAVAT